MRKIAFALIFFTILISCDKDKQSLDTKSGLLGTWEWLSTDGGIAYHIHETPAKTGKSYELKFTSNSYFLIYENGAEIFSGSYKIIKENSIYSGEMEDFIQVAEEKQFQSIVINGILTINGDSLSISDNYYDGVSSRYKRVD